MDEQNDEDETIVTIDNSDGGIAELEYGEVVKTLITNDGNHGDGQNNTEGEAINDDMSQREDTSNKSSSSEEEAQKKFQIP